MTTTPYRKGYESEVRLVEEAGATGHRLAERTPGSHGVFDVMVIDANGRSAPHRHTIWLINVKRNDWAPPDEREALSLTARRHGCVPVLANHEVIPGHSWWHFRGVLSNGDMTPEWDAFPWEIEA